MNSNRLRIGITAIGSGVGQSVVDACRTARLPVEIVGLDVQPFAYGGYDCDEFRMMPRWRDPQFLDKLEELVRQCRIDLLIPGLDNELPILSAVTDRFERVGTTVLVGPLDLVAMTRNKIEWSKTLSAISDAIVPSWSGDETSSRLKRSHDPFPLIAKPIGGSASAGVKIIRGENDLGLIEDTDVVQPFIRPDDDDPNFQAIENALRRGALLQASEISVQYVFSRASHVLGRMASYNRLKNGVPIEIVPVDWPEIWEALDPIVAYFTERGITGPVNIQGRLGKEGLKFFEMNARFTGITGLRALMGFNEVDALISEFSNGRLQSTAPLEVHPGRVGIRQVISRTVTSDANEPLSTVVDPIRKSATPRRTIAITGATGWLGRHLVASLLADDAVESVIALVRDETKVREVFGKADTARLRIAQWDGGTNDSWNPGHVDTLIHLASARPPHGPAAIQESARFTQMVADTVARYQIPGVVYVSSQSVYGTQEGPWTEETVPAPDSPYGLMKLVGEFAFESVADRSRSTGVTVIRLARLYGSAEGMRWDELPHRLAATAARNESKPTTPGGPVYDLVNIRDAVSALRAVLNAGVSPGFRRFNCGSGVAVSIEKIATVARNQATGSVQGSYRGPAQDPARSSATGVMDSSDFRRVYDWTPRETLETTMAELIAKADRMA